MYKRQIYQIWWIESIGSENRIETFLPELECSSVQCSHRLCLSASHHCFIVQFAAVVRFACFPAVSYALTLAVWLLTGICPLLSHSHLHTHTQPFNGPMSGTTRVGRYQKKHLSTHTHPVHQTSFINFLHLLRSIASSFFNLHAWQSFSATSVHVLFGLSLGLGPSSSYSIHVFTQSSSFSNTCPYHHSLFCSNTNVMSSIPNLSQLLTRKSVLPSCHTSVWPATRQRWHSRPYPSRSWYSIKRPRRDARLSWSSWLVTYRDGTPARRQSPVPVLTGPDMG